MPSIVNYQVHKKRIRSKIPSRSYRRWNNLPNKLKVDIHLISTKIKENRWKKDCSTKPRVELSGRKRNDSCYRNLNWKDYSISSWWRRCPRRETRVQWVLKPNESHIKTTWTIQQIWANLSHGRRFYQKGKIRSRQPNCCNTNLSDWRRSWSVKRLMVGWWRSKTMGRSISNTTRWLRPNWVYCQKTDRNW